MSVLAKLSWLPLLLPLLYALVLLLLITPIVQKEILFLNRVKWPLWADFDNPERYGLAPSKTRNLQLRTPDGETLGAWHVLPQAVYRAQQPFPPVEVDHGVFDAALREYPTVLYFHGNAGNRAHHNRVRSYSALSALDCNVIALDYRGFGSSTGTPSEPGLLLDARTVWDFVQDVKSSSERAIVHDEIHGFHIQSQSSGGTTSTSTSNSGKDVILLGQSLGTGVASALAGQLADEGMQPRAIIFIAPFTSIPDILETMNLFGFIPLLAPLQAYPAVKRYLLSHFKYTFNSTAALAKTSSPTLLLHARNDHTIPHHYSSKLFQSLSQATHEGKTIDGSVHIHNVSYPNWGTVYSFNRSTTNASGNGEGSGAGVGSEVIYWDGLKGGHNDLGWAEGSVDLIRRVARLP